MTSAFQIQKTSREPSPEDSNDVILETETGLVYSFPLGPTRFAITIADRDPAKPLRADHDPATRP